MPTHLCTVWGYLPSTRAELSKCHGNGVTPKYVLSCPLPKRSLVMEELLSKRRTSGWLYGGVTLSDCIFGRSLWLLCGNSSVVNKGLTLLHNFMSVL